MGDLTWLDDVARRHKAAMDMVVALCLPRGAPGAREWLMSIPARPYDDPDLVISASLSDVPLLVRAVRDLAAALDMVVQHLEDPSLLTWREDELRAVLERWGRGGDSGVEKSQGQERGAGKP